jgi:nucleoside-diphosphate-sugar epimerase
VKIVVTGNTGFVGRYLVPVLETQGHEVTGLSRSGGKDVLHQSSLEGLGKFDVLIHLAALSFVPQSFIEPHKFYYENLTATLNCLEACRNNGSKMIFLSSYVYGQPKYLPIGEDHPVHPANPYMQSKYLGEQLCQAYSRDFKVPVNVIRPFNVYGRGQGNDFLIPSIINQLPSGEIRLKDPRPKRDFVHVEDLVNAISLLLNFTSYYSVYNIGSGKSISIGDIIDILKTSSLIAEEKVFFSNEQRPSEVLETCADISKALNDIGWTPRKDFRQELVAIAAEKIKNRII